MYDPYFSAHSYGFRPGRSAQQAVEQAAGYVGQGKVWVVDIDLKSFFDEINHERLMSGLSKAISDERLLKLIRLYLKAGLMKDGLESQRLAGTPQGGPLSPLLSNIVLDELDRELEARGLSFVRYADDCNIFVRSRRSAERVMNTLIAFIEVNRIIQGWAVYYRRCNTWLSTLRKLDGWIRKRLRCYTLKQHKRKYPTCLFLRKLGVEENYAWHAVMYRSWWSMANYRPVMKAMGIRWFAEQGLRSLVAVQSG